MTRIGVIGSPRCWWCGAAEQSVEHLYTRCRRRRKEKRKLVTELEKEGIKWQAQAERKWLANLPANEKAVAPLQMGIIPIHSISFVEYMRHARSLNKLSSEWFRTHTGVLNHSLNVVDSAVQSIWTDRLRLLRVGAYAWVKVGSGGIQRPKSATSRFLRVRTQEFTTLLLLVAVSVINEHWSLLLVTVV